MSLLSSIYRQFSSRLKVWHRPKLQKDKKQRFRNKLNFAGRFQRNRPLRWLIVLLFWFFALMMLYSAGLKHIEGYDWSEAIWQGWQTFTTVGYGNAPPVTVWGRLYTIVLSTIGIAIVGAVFSAAFDYSHFLSELKRSGLMKNPHKDGYVIFNFPDTYQLENFIRELRTVEPEVGICLVDNRIEELPKSISSLQKIHFIKGSTLDEATYQRANLNANKVVIVFPYNPTDGESDGATKTTVDLIESFVTDNTRIIHILVDTRNHWMFRGSKSIPILEAFELFAIVQECQDPYSAQIIESLMLNTEGATPKTVEPQHISGWTWSEFVITSMLLAKKKKIACTPFAIVVDGEPNSCPHPEFKIPKSCYLSIIADNNFKWNEFEKDLVAFKVSQS